MKPVQVGERPFRGVADGLGWLEGRILAQVGHHGPALHLDRAGIGRQLGKHDLHEGRFAAAVAAHQTDLLARLDGERHPVENDLAPEGVMHVGDGEQRHGV